MYIGKEEQWGDKEKAAFNPGKFPFWHKKDKITV